MHRRRACGDRRGKCGQAANRSFVIELDGEVVASSFERGSNWGGVRLVARFARRDVDVDEVCLQEFLGRVRCAASRWRAAVVRRATMSSSLPRRSAASKRCARRWATCGGVRRCARCARVCGEASLLATLSISMGSAPRESPSMLIKRARRRRERTACTTIEPSHDRNAWGSARSARRVRALMKASWTTSSTSRAEPSIRVAR